MCLPKQVPKGTYLVGVREAKMRKNGADNNRVRVQKGQLYIGHRKHDKIKPIFFLLLCSPNIIGLSSSLTGPPILHCD